MPTPPTFDQQWSAKSERDSEEENCQSEFKNADDYGKLPGKKLNKFHITKDFFLMNIGHSR